jgi:CBS domain-containing protein
MLPIDETTTVREDEPLLDAIGDMQQRSLDRALVLAGDQVVGLLSITDIGRLVARSGR